MLAILSPHVNAAATSLAKVRVELATADTLEISADLQARERAASMKAMAYVWSSACLEQFVKQCLLAVLSDLSLRSLPKSVLRPSLCTLVHANDFDSYVDSKRLVRWEKACDILDGANAVSPAQFGSVVLPLDGRTLRGRHFEIIWRVFGFAGSSLPSQRHRLALEDLAEGRNRVAHGSLDPITFGRQKATADVQRLVAQVEDQVLHLAEAADRYLANQEFKR